MVPVSHIVYHYICEKKIVKTEALFPTAASGVHYRSMKDNKTYSVFPAREEHIPPMIELLELLFTQEADFKPRRDVQAQGFRLIMGTPQAGQLLVLGEPGGPPEGIIGMINILYTVSTALGGRAAVFEDVIVAPEFRGLGYGTLMLNEAAVCARKAGCLRISLVTDEENNGAREFYRRLGFEESRMVTLRRLL